MTRPIGKRSVSGSARTPPRNATAPIAPAARIVPTWPGEPGTSSAIAGRRDGDQELRRPARQRPRHRDHGRRDDGGRSELEPVHPTRAREIDVARPDRERRQDHRRRQREAEPGREPAELAGAVDADRDPDLARRRPRQEIRERNQLAELLLADPAAARDVLGPEVADVGHRAAERRQPEAKGGAKDLARGSGYLDAPGFQSGSSAPASALAARARMNSRSERRLR